MSTVTHLMSNFVYRIVTAGLIVALGACPSPGPKGPSKTLATYPHAADRYARLLRRQLTSTNPIAFQDSLSCEASRLVDSLGPDEMRLRLQAVEDSTYRSSADSQARVRVDGAVSGRSYEASGAFCDSVNAIADREDPIVRVDTSRNH